MLAVGNFFIYFKTRRGAKKIRCHLFPDGYVPGGEAHSKGLAEHYKHYLSPEGEAEVINERRKVNFFYSMYNNITSIFPLMGILGTVISLISMVNKSSEQIQDNFMLALTSTLWGIIFAIIFKALNGYLSSVIDNLDEVFELYIERNNKAFGLVQTNDDKRNSELVATGYSQAQGQQQRDSFVKSPRTEVKGQPDQAKTQRPNPATARGRWSEYEMEGADRKTGSKSVRKQTTKCR